MSWLDGPKKVGEYGAFGESDDSDENSPRRLLTTLYV